MIPKGLGILVAAVLLGGCSSEGPSDDRVPESLSRPDLPTLRAEAPSVRFGGSTEPPEHVFSRISGIRELPNREIVVVDRGSAELRFFAPDGRPLRVAGGKGEGPGEFLEPQLGGVLGSDTVAVFDAELGRLTLFSLQGDLGRTLDVPPGGRKVGIASDRFLWVERSTIPFRGVEGNQTHQLYEYRRTDLLSGQTDTLVVLEGPRIDITVEGNVVRMSGLAASSVLQASILGSDLFVLDPAKNALRRFDIQGDSVSSPTLSPVETTNSRGVRRMVSSSDGDLWIQTPGNESTSSWRVYSVDGVVKATVEFPGNFRPGDVKENRVWGVLTDEFGVESVARFNLPRSGPN